MNVIGLSHLEPGAGINLVRIHNGAMTVIPPNTPVLAETPHEALVNLAEWLGMAKPGKARKDAPEPPQRFPWATKNFEINVGASFMVARCQRGRSPEEHGYMVTYHLGVPNTLWQGAVWTPMQVLEYANEWMASIPMQKHERLDAMRIVDALDWEADEVFAIRVQPTSMMPPDEPVPAREAPWTIASVAPPIQCGIGEGVIANYFKEQLGTETVGFFAARLRKNTLEIGQRLPDPNLEDEDGD